MSASRLTIRSVKARAVNAPISRPVKNAFGVIPSAPLVLIDVATDQGVTGHAYIFAYMPLTLRPLVRLIEDIGVDLVGKAIVPFDLMRDFDRKFRLLGWQGLVGMAVSGLDMAFWDALGQAAAAPVVQLLGGAPRPIRAYDSYGVVDPVADKADLLRSLERGFLGIKIKGGDGDAANDERVVRGVRDLIGPNIALMIDFNQSLDPVEAEAARRPAVAELGVVDGDDDLGRDVGEGELHVRLLQGRLGRAPEDQLVVELAAVALGGRQAAEQRLVDGRIDLDDGELVEGGRLAGDALGPGLERLPLRCGAPQRQFPEPAAQLVALVAVELGRPTLVGAGDAMRFAFGRPPFRKACQNRLF